MMFCNLAAWGIAQNLEGLKLFQYINTQPMQFGNEVFYPLTFSPTRGVNGLSGLLTIFLIIISLLNIRAGFYLNRWIGGIILFLWIVPGILSLLGYVPDTRSYGPEVFRFGSSFTGSTYSAAANLLICVVAGWSVIMLIGSWWKKNTFKNAYDHIWYALGLIAALYFVVDSSLPSYKSDLSEADDRSTRIFQLYRTGEENLEALCTDLEAANLAPDLCSLAPTMKWGIKNHLDMDNFLRARIDLPEWVAEMGSDPVLMRQIKALNNWACQQGKSRKACQTVPFETAINSEDIKTHIIFPYPEYAAVLENLHKKMQKADTRIQEVEEGHNARYFVFLILAFIAGGKIANASRSLVKDDSVHPPSWLFTFLRFISVKIVLILKVLTTRGIIPLFRLICRGAVWLARLHQSRADRREKQKDLETEPE